MLLGQATPLEMEMIISARRRLTADVVEFELRSISTNDLPSFRAGAHIKVSVLPTSRRPDTRSYSLVNGPNEKRVYKIAVKREHSGAGGSQYVHSLPVGAALRVSRPSNDFELSWTADNHILIAGGIGITPILSMARHLSAARRNFELHYVARNAELAAYSSEVSAMPESSITFDGGKASQGLDLDSILASRSDNAHIYVCGPAPFIAFVLKRGSLCGFADHRMHFELFQPTQAESDRPVTVHLARSKRTVEVPTGVTILDAVCEAGLDPLFDCRRGECGICAVSVLSGEPDHRDFTLTDQERRSNSKICVCVSRARSRVLTLNM